MNTISFVFKVHHPFYLRTYRFFDIGQRHNYYDDYRNKYLLKRFSERSYYRANDLMHKLLDRYGNKFGFSFAFTGITVDQMQWYMPELLDNFRELIARPGVELLATDYSSSAVPVMDKELWKQQVKLDMERISEAFGQKPQVLAGPQLMYDDEMGQAAAEMGFKGVLTEGAKPVLGWKSSHVLYSHPGKKLKLILRDGNLSEDISQRFSDRSSGDWPLTAEKFIEKMQVDRDRLNGNDHITIYINYGVLGEFQDEGTGIFNFFESLVDQTIAAKTYKVVNPTALCAMKEDFPALYVPFTVSDMDEEKDLTAFYANELQRDVMENWRRVCHVMLKCKDEELLKDFRFLTGVEILTFMSTKYFSTHPTIRYSNPYDSPYDAYINYMNVWSDFLERLEEVGLLNERGEMTERKVDVSVKKKATAVAKKTTATAKKTTTAAKKTVKKVAETTKKKATATAKKVAPAVKKATAIATAKKATATAKKTVKKVAETAKKKVATTAKKATATVKKTVKKAEPAVKKTVKKATATVKKAVAPAKKKVATTAKKTATTAKKATATVKKTAKKTVKKNVTAAKKALAELRKKK